MLILCFGFRMVFETIPGPARRARWRGVYVMRAMALAATTCATGFATAQQAPQAPPPRPTLRTRWAAEVTPAHVLAEYPRPQLVRERWTNLNGTWEYAITDSSAATPPAKFDGSILVPFAVESQLSGVQKTVNEQQLLWYRRTFTAPARKNGERLLLHFGAVDWKATISVNGKEVGTHTGGYDPFTYDITDALTASGPQTLVVRVWDPTDAGDQPRGKQTRQPEGIFYTSVTGIWQTVWLEPVPAAYVARLATTSNIDNGSVTVSVTTGGATASGSWKVTALANGKSVAHASGAVGTPIVVTIPNAHLWSPNDPFLYDLDITVGNDHVRSYAGLRKTSVCADAAGTRRLCLNNKPLFQYGPLDQGWWPDGLYTAPTDAALKFDIEQTKRLGFNMIRKHIKVEPARWYYYTDKLGVLVWQDMPSGNNDLRWGKEAHTSELARMIDELYSHPSIVVWVPFNEGWGQYDTERVTAWLKMRDTTRPVNNASGWSDMHVGDITDAHVYTGPGMPPFDAARAMVLGEFGGLGLPTPGHMWVDQANWGYQTYKDTTELAQAYAGLVRDLRVLAAEGLSAAVYTQTTDVETESNGLFTYDRAILKLPAALAVWHSPLYGTPTKREVVAATSWKTPQTWQYTNDTPDTNWTKPEYDAHGWKSGPGGFGQPLQPGYARAAVPLKTWWQTPEIWLRRTFTVTPEQAANSGALYWRLDLMGAVDAYINGQLVLQRSGGTSGVGAIAFDSTARRAVHAGENTLAVYAHRTRPLPAFQFIDLGIDYLPELDANVPKR